MTLKIATWNINGIKARVERLQDWLKQAEPDIVCLQEIKSVDENFPASVFEDMNYNVAVHGQKSYNGVAILSKLPFDEILKQLPGDETDDHARYLEAVISVPSGAVRVASIYLPNGNPVDSEKYPYKLAWMDRLIAHAQGLLGNEEAVILAGDYNVIQQAGDVHDPEAWIGDALYRPETAEKFRTLLNIGLTDAVRASTDETGLYSFWDYQAGAWQKNNGILIDHLLLSPEAADRLLGCGIDKFTRSWERPSDHVPVWIDLDL